MTVGRLMHIDSNSSKGRLVRCDGWSILCGWELWPLFMVSGPYIYMSVNRMLCGTLSKIQNFSPCLMERSKVVKVEEIRKWSCMTLTTEQCAKGTWPNFSSARSG